LVATQINPLFWLAASLWLPKLLVWFFDAAAYAGFFYCIFSAPAVAAWQLVASIPAASE